MRRAALILALLTLASDAGATAYFVNGSVAGPGSGTIGDPYKKIQAALNRARTARDTVYIRGTTYSILNAAGGDSLNLYGSGSDAVGQIVLTAYPGETANIVNGTAGTTRLIDTNRCNTGDAACLAGGTGNHWTFNRLTISNNNVTADCIRINTTHVIMDSCDVSNGRTEGITIVGDTITVEDGSVHDFDRDDTGAQFDCHCIHVDSGVSTDITAVIVQRNTIRHCSGDGIQFTVGTGVDTSTYSRGCKVLDNTFIGGNTDSTLIEGAIDVKGSHDLEVARNDISGYGNKAPIVFQKGPQRMYVHDNLIHDSQAGMDIHSEDGGWIIRGARVTGNLVYNLHGLAGFIMYGFKFDGVADSKIWNNTVHWAGPNNCRGFRVEGGGVAGWGLRTSVLENNLSYCPSASASNVTGTNQGMDSTVCNYNGWFVGGRTGKLIGNSAGVGIGTGTNNDLTGAGDPGFVAMGSNFSLAAASPCIDAGTDSLIVRGFNGTKPDLGYVEFVVAAPPPPPSEEITGTGGSGNMQRHVLFSGADTDSSEQASDWVPLFYAGNYPRRVIIKLSSSHGAFSASGADSAFSDSIITMHLLFSDSACCTVTGKAGLPIRSCADSVVLDVCVPASADTNTNVAVMSWPCPVNKPLRAPANGSGLITLAASSLPTGFPYPKSDFGVVPKHWMRVRVTPLRRMTANTSTCSGAACGNRVNGLKGLRGIAEVWYGGPH